MRVLEFTLENVKKVRVAQLRPDPNLVQVSGPNGSGKTSLIDGLFWLFTGASDIDPEPIRRGATKATVYAKLGDRDVELIVERRFSKSGSTLYVWAADGSKLGSPQQVIDALVGQITLDPLKFARMDGRQRGEVMLSILGIEQQLFDIDEQRKVVFEERTEHNREVNRLKEQLKAYDPDLLIGDLPEEIDTSKLLSDHKAQQEREARVRELKAKVTYARDDIDNLDQRIARVDDDIKDLEARMGKLQEEKKRLAGERSTLVADLEQAKQAVEDSGIEAEPLEDIETQIENAQIQNKKRETAVAARAVESQLLAAQGQVRERTLKIEDLDEFKRKTITAANYPVEGLRFDPSFGVTFNDTPFDQLSTSEQIRVSMAIAMAQNPKLRVLRINDGSLLDSKNLALIEDLARQNDFQVWVERVDESGKIGVVIEDGTVKSK